MKKLIVFMVLGCAAFMFTGCGMSKITTDIGVKIGESFAESAAKGMVTAEQSIKAWPYVSGQIKGLMADNYKIEMVPMGQSIISILDSLAKKETLSTEERGFVIGSYVRLESIALEYAWDKYGVSIWDLVKKTIGS